MRVKWSVGFQNFISWDFIGSFIKEHDEISASTIPTSNAMTFWRELEQKFIFHNCFAEVLAQLIESQLKDVGEAEVWTSAYV